MKHTKCLILSGFLAAGLTSACTTAAHRAEGSIERYQHQGSELRGALLRHFAVWEGVPHRYGGTDKSGIDCSGFVQASYRDLFKVNLPRSAREQSKVGRSVSLNDLQVGDLVFFRGAFSPHHVGIYLGDGTFVHVSSTKGVTRTKVDDQYWSRYISGARRII